MFETSALFLENLKATEDTIINQGGTSSTKTYSILHVLFHRSVREPKAVTTIVGQDIPNLKAGALRDAQNIIASSPELQKAILSYNKSERIYEFFNGAIMEFKSYSDAQDAKSGKRDYLFINEANGIPYPLYEELNLRTRKKTYIDYNPNAEFWVHEKLIGKPGVKLIISDHRCNPFLPQSMRDKIEALKDKDIELWKVYARGMTGKIEGLVFHNWSVGTVTSPKEPIYGLDFGYNDPACLVEIFIDGTTIEARELFYESGMTTGDMIRRLDTLGIDKHKYIYADSANPDKIEEIFRAGYNIHPQYKPKGSVMDGITKLKDYRILVDQESVNMRKELGAYKWKMDKNGKTLDEPVDFMNHSIDPLRAAVYTHISKGTFDYSW